MKLLKFISLICFFMLSTFFSSKAQWVQTNGVFGGVANCFYANDTVAFVGLPGAGIYRRNIAASKWTSSATNLGNTYVNCLFQKDSLIYAGTNGGLFASSDNGRTWKSKNGGFPFIVGISDIGSSGSSLFATSTNNKMYRSLDGGNTWTALGISYIFRRVRGNQNYVFAATSSGVLVSSNNGTTWALSNTGLTNTSIWCMAVTDTAIYVGTNGSGTFKSVNNGASWTAVGNAGKTIYEVVMKSGAVYAAAIYGGGVSKTVDGGATWTTFNTGLPNLTVTCLGVFKNTLLTSSYSSTITSSPLASANWTSYGTGLIATGINEVTGNGNSIYAATKDYGVWKSTDNGANWTNITGKVAQSYITSVLFYNNYLFIGTVYDPYIHRTANEGTTWQQLTGGGTTYTSYSNLYAYNGALFVHRDRIILKSSDNGTSWSLANAGMPDAYVSAFTGTSQALFAGTNTSWLGTRGGGVFKSTDNGTNWTACNTGYPVSTDVWSLASKDSIIIAGTSGGIIRSSNNGTTWTTVYNSEAYSLYFLGSVVFAGGKYGNVWISLDYGQSWQVFKNTLPSVEITSFCSNSTHVFAATDGGGVYKLPISQIPVPTVASITTYAASSLTSYSAYTGGNITNNGSAFVTAKGVCYGTSPNPTIAGNKTNDGTGSDSFGSSLSGLKANTTYYVRAYATNMVGTVYGNEISFTTTIPALATLTTTEILDLMPTTASSGGYISNDGTALISERGVCWSTTPSPTVADAKTSNGTGIGSFSSALTGLTQATTYYVRAYAINAAGTAYGDEISFTTPVPSLPTLTTTAVSAIAPTKANSGGNISSDGYLSVTARGVCWSTSSAPTIANNITTNGTGLGGFTSSLTGLTPSTVYYVRAYATNSLGTAYGDEVSFTSAAPALATISFTSVTTIRYNSAIGNANITNDGGSPITARGICYGTVALPTIADNITSNGTGTGTFAATLGLSPGTTYYARVYATNGVGTVYSAQRTFTTPLSSMGVLTTAPISGITATDALSGGDITDDGGSPVTARGVCWSTASSPTISNNKTIDGTGTGSFVSAITGLNQNAVYYVRAYVTNSAGTAYGNQLTFTASSLTVLSNASLKNNISIYPNPVKGAVHLDINSLNAASVEIRILNFNSSMVYLRKINNFKGDAQELLDLSFLEKGVYSIQVATDGEIFTDKLIVAE